MQDDLKSLSHSKWRCKYHIVFAPKYRVGLQYILDKRIKRMKDRALSVKVELSHNNLTKGGHILHEQEYNTGHGVQAIPDEIRGEIRRQPCQPEI